MKLPKIKKEDLPKDLQDSIDGDEIEFDPIVSVEDVFDLPITPDDYDYMRQEIGKKLIESRKKLEDYRIQQRNSEN